jgi:hypothetical protein
MLFHNSPDPDRYRGEDYIEGVIDKTDIRLSELHTEYRQVTYDSKGRRREHWVTIFRGLFISADFHKHFHGVTLVLPDTEQSWLGGFGQWLQSISAKLGNQPGELVKMEDPEFERLFKVFSTDQVEARYILTPNMIRRIVDFRKQNEVAGAPVVYCLARVRGDIRPTITTSSHPRCLRPPTSCWIQARWRNTSRSLSSRWRWWTS